MFHIKHIFRGNFLGHFFMRLFETVAKLCFYGNSLGSNPDISQKYKMGDINKEVANTL
jgi:hypothetical protein